jgi:geranylgeranyl pyrophosphate synthase
VNARLEHDALTTLLEAERAAVEAALVEISDSLRSDDRVTDAVRYALRGGGKRLRPILCVAAYRACGAQPRATDAVYRAASSIVLIHTDSLVHVVLPCMDDDDLRRGRGTAHRVYGSRVAAAAGFALIPLACRVLVEGAAALGLDVAQRDAAVAELCRGAGAAGMVGGQVLGLEAERHTVAADELRRIHGLKTGALFRASLRLGATLAAAPDPVRDALGEFGLRLGLAFQIADDVLDVTRDAAALGKTPGKDAAAAKATFVSLLGVDRARESAREEAAAAIGVLRDARLESPPLEALARFAADRDR